ncbi:MAG: ATP-binding protein [Cyclobacteriaceae bacterium]|nr:ATP-binding protein [Cyclobacteriaceae bacterium]
MKAAIKIQPTQSPEPFREKVLQTYNFKRVQSACRVTINERLMTLITGETGFGKTTALNHFRCEHPNVFMVTVHASMGSSRTFWHSVLQELPGALTNEKHDPLIHSNLFGIIRKIAAYLNARPGSLLILDQANKFSYRGLEYLHELRDLTMNSCAIILSAPAYFKTNLETWTKKNKPGVPELTRRINHYEELLPPTTAEVKAFCKHYGLDDEETWRTLVGAKNFGTLTNKIREILRTKTAS